MIMTLLQLKYFLAVCKFQTVSDAATYLYVSQPSLSASIKELEKEFGVALFHRHHHVMSLTPEGETLYRSAKALLEQAIYIFKNSDISVDSGYDPEQGVKISRRTIEELSLAPNAKNYLRLCGLWSRHIDNRSWFGEWMGW